jgi:hypothetical protein
LTVDHAGDGEVYMLGANDTAQLARHPRHAPSGTTLVTTPPDASSSDPVTTRMAIDSAGASNGLSGPGFDWGQTCGGGGFDFDCSQTPVRVGALEAYPLADVGSGGGHEVVVTQKVGV